MSRLITLGLLSQITDPAKTLADAYQSYVLSQSGTLDYATVYGIYKDEVLVDADYAKMVDYWDFRAGMLLSGTTISKAWSMIPPYRLAQNVGSTPTLSNDALIAGILTFNFTHFQSYDFKCKIKVNTTHEGNTYPVIHYTQESNVAAGIRIPTSEYVYTYWYNTAGTNYGTYKSPAHTGVIEVTQVVDYSTTKMTTITTPLGTASGNTFSGTLRQFGTSGIQSRMIGGTNRELYWAKFYTL